MHFRTRIAVCIAAVGCATNAFSRQVPDQPPDRVVDRSAVQGIPATLLEWDSLPLPASIRGIAIQPFTSLGIGWTSDVAATPPEQWVFVVRSRIRDGEWSTAVELRGETSPDENPSGLYWTSVYMAPGGTLQDELSISIRGPGYGIRHVRISTAGLRPSGILPGSVCLRRPVAGSGVSAPPIILRQAWWGDLPPDSLNPKFGPIPITISHAVVHESLMNDNPPDPALEIRSIWNLHVYGNGWSDIGYNFLVDQYGNVYQGRYNPWLDTTDVWGAHAGEANSKSVGICLLGTFGGPAAISPAAAAATGLERTIGWRFSQRSVDPFGSAPIVAFQSLPDR